MWENSLNNRVICGAGSLSEIGRLAKETGGRLLVVTYRDGIRQTGLIGRLEDILKRNGADYRLYEGVIPDPDIRCIDEGKAFCLENGCDSVLGIGGGSALDAAKAIAMLAVNGGSARDYQMGLKSIRKQSLPVIAVPTTAGTGSEATKVAVVSNLEEGIKKSIAHPFMTPGTALIDPELMISLPSGLTASTGLDALGHAIESYVSLNANPASEAYGIKAIELITANLAAAVENGKNTTARENMAVASYLAGAALNAGVGLAHILGQPLGAVCHVSHGDAISILLPVAMELNLEHAAGKYAAIARAMGVDTRDMTDVEAGRQAVLAVKELRRRTGAASSLGGLCRIGEATVAAILDSVARSTAHIKCNPRPVDVDLLAQALMLA